MGCHAARTYPTNSHTRGTKIPGTYFEQSSFRLGNNKMVNSSIWFGLLVISTTVLNGDGMEELKIGFSDCPAVVQRTLRREAFTADIKAVYKEGEDEEAIYEADVVLD